MHNDVKRWDSVHKEIHKEGGLPSSYAQEKEELFPRGSIVVEMGGGTGEDAVYFLRQGHSVVILDISEFALKKAEEKAKEAGVAEKLVTKHVDFGLHKLPIKESSVDVVYSRISLHYFGSEHTTKLFQDIEKMLKEGGVAYLTFKSPRDKEEMEYLEEAGTEYEENVFIENKQLRSRFSEEQFREMLKNAGIKDFEVGSYDEDLDQEEKGHKSTLHLTEVIIKK